jgi:betaine-aldehyde dehydrogenase
MTGVDDKAMVVPNEPFQYQMWIGGKWVEANSRQRFRRESPAHDVPVGEYPLAGAADVDKAVQAARQAFDQGAWPRQNGAERSRLLCLVGEAIHSHRVELAYIECLESGKPIRQALDEMEWSAELWNYAATTARHIYGDTYNTLGEEVAGLIFREAIGVVGIITPWNFPLLIVSQKLPFALAAGCTAVIKPSELTPGTTLRLGKILEDAGLPSGVVNILSGEGVPVGSRMAAHPAVDMISFTGSTEVGRLIMTAGASNLKKVELELGGKNPQIVLADADLESALNAVVFGVYFNAGQCCNSGSRLLIEERVAESFLDSILSLARSVRVGDPLDESTKVGAIINQEQLDKVIRYVASGQEQGAELQIGGNRLGTERGRFFEPTVFARVTSAMDIAREEIFGPVLAVVTFADLDEAIRIANGTIYGLSAGVWTRDISKAFRLSHGIRAGTVWVNSFMDGYPELSFGGYNQSGVGRELGRFAIEEFTELKAVHVAFRQKPSNWTCPHF